MKYEKHFVSRTEYETACGAVNVGALSDDECQSYGVRYGDFRYPQYDPDHIVKMHLAYLRMCALDEAEEQEKRQAEAERQPAAAHPPSKTGQLWEPCEVCGREPVYMPLMLCDRCWPK
jgi:ribosomal protein S14